MIYAPHVLSKSPELPDLTAARASARIAELEDWHRRALEWMRAEVAGDMAALRMKLVEEATR